MGLLAPKRVLLNAGLLYLHTRSCRSRSSTQLPRLSCCLSTSSTQFYSICSQGAIYHCCSPCMNGHNCRGVVRTPSADNYRHLSHPRRSTHHLADYPSPDSTSIACPPPWSCSKVRLILLTACQRGRAQLECTCDSQGSSFLGNWQHRSISCSRSWVIL